MRRGGLGERPRTAGVLTPRGLTLLFGGVLLWAVGRLLGVDEVGTVAVASATLVVVAGVSVALSTATISARRTITTLRLPHGASGEIVLDVRNNARLPCSLLLIEDRCPSPLFGHRSGPRFVVPSLGPGRVASLRYRVVGGARGRYTIGPLQVYIRDPFGLTQRTRGYTTTAQVLVHPPIEALPTGAIRGRHYGTGSTQQRRVLNAGDEFYTMREYIRGDDLRQVHWPSTAHRQVLMVRQQEQPWQAQATVFCDTRRIAHQGAGADSTLEKTVSVAASLVSHLAARGYALRLVTEADDRRVRVESRARLLDRLAALQASAVRALAPALEGIRGGEGLLVAVVAPPSGTGTVAGHPDVRALVRAGHGYSGRICLVMGSGSRDRWPEELARVLTGAGWTTTTVAPGQALNDRWPRSAVQRGARLKAQAIGEVR